ncbi:glycosyltransferase family A protein, partial [Photobacterium phosphoreum]|uniref:glycosyltransferase family A protein n=1 Tax=Photobacterium phosphoreum TaxID=659 RepID=UPI000D18219F
MSKLVSIILPCYNAENYLYRYINSIFVQTYKNIEIIFVNDGSSDRTKQVIYDCINILKQVEIDSVYLEQKNSGLAASINIGLKEFKGDYLTWGDPDDFLSPSSIEERVLFLEQNLDYGFVRTDAILVYEDQLNIPVGKIKSSEKEWIFDDLILERKIFLTAGCYLCRSDIFREALPNLNIYDDARGQNWQLLLPIALISKCGYIKLSLNNIVIRNSSMSNSDNSLIDDLFRCDEHENILTNVINSLKAVSYTHLTLPTIRLVEISVVA